MDSVLTQPACLWYCPAVHLPQLVAAPSSLVMLCVLVSTVRSIVLFIRDHLAEPALRFHLYTSPPKTVLRGAKLSLLQAGLVPATVLYVGLEDPSAMGMCLHVFTLYAWGRGEGGMSRD